jgi:hypothetical protein
MQRIVIVHCQLCSVLFMLSVTFKPFMLSVIMLSVTYKPLMLSVIMLNVVMLNVVMLNVVAPLQVSMLLNFFFFTKGGAK